jgi:hypothetical protein
MQLPMAPEGSSYSSARQTVDISVLTGARYVYGGLLIALFYAARRIAAGVLAFVTARDAIRRGEHIPAPTAPLLTPDAER